MGFEERSPRYRVLASEKGIQTYYITEITVYDVSTITIG